ncbi:hypothetical protein ABE28_015995 [Peribacillus muralis]|uniref:Glycosyl transferase family 1 domain-containing protein n=1 Tax=Peribacillus muralis TaxID=264697 RepID=A0A1B3XRM9_9BACI|nr:glycosyltransferase [Peribacillus muralis]AOH55864.1 hypothetical protein ABE28_015995 [Peribacillus muralis]
MDILFLGGVFAKDKEEEIYKKSNGTVQAAANALQWNIIEGLDSWNITPIKIINSIFVGSFPNRYKDIYIKSRHWSHTNGANDKDVGFLNLFGVKHMWKAKALSIQILKWAETKNDEKKVIIIYSMHTPFIYAAIKAKQVNPNVHICLICPDLPEYMNPGGKDNKLLSILKSMDKYFMNRFLKMVDSFVFLTKYMEERIAVGTKPWIVMEGIVNTSELIVKQNDEFKKSNEKVVLYTGTLNKAYGIMDLLESFNIITDPSIHLWICGAGDAQVEVEKSSAYDERIKYFGQVSRNTAMKLQSEANLLINPRNNEGEYTKFSFPSKTMEYLLSGTPVLIYKLQGIPEEYYSYIFTIEGIGPIGIASSIERVLKNGRRELKLHGMKARNFVINEKNNKIQAKRIIDLVNEIKTDKVL